MAYGGSSGAVCTAAGVVGVVGVGVVLAYGGYKLLQTTRYFCIFFLADFVFSYCEIAKENVVVCSFYSCLLYFH